ncbi:hypothetical protein E2C01_012336 [Portunus trituberculatus]|uniref:Uncharacterized protein n=1 Tax=Portunus trituberculatus TaxID=210409 RepID=A0A5B7DDC8_PORTR|nr:hypothetical protein [Portunus trituberculatus]
MLGYAARAIQSCARHRERKVASLRWCVNMIRAEENSWYGGDIDDVEVKKRKGQCVNLRNDMMLRH